jgi:hypothetical protein
MFIEMQLLIFLLVTCYFSLSALGRRPHYCTGNEHIQGKWQMNLTKEMEKSYLCCGWDQGDFYDAKYCGPSLNPRAINTTNFKGSNMYFGQPGGHACVCDAREGVFDVHQREKYYWHPANCTLPRWNAKKFCDLLSQRKILMIGDSTNRQTSSALISMISAGKGNCSDHIFSARSDNLVSQANGSKNLSHIIRTYGILPDIVVLSAGAHIRSLADYQKNWIAIQSQINLVHARYPQMKFLWKTQNPGHVDCQMESKPINQYAMNTEKKDVYHWGLHPEFDRISIERVQNISSFYRKQQQQQQNITNIPLIQVVDMYPLYLRPDAHPHYIKDCLHYCQPGPLNLFSILLMNMLMTRQI